MIGVRLQNIEIKPIKVTINKKITFRTKNNSLLKLSKSIINSLNIIKNLSILEIHFWASKFMLKEKAAKAWRALYS